MKLPAQHPRAKSSVSEHRKRHLSFTTDLPYMLALFITECFHEVLRAYKMPYNITKSIQQAIKFVLFIKQRTTLDSLTLFVGSIYYANVCDKLRKVPKIDARFISSRRIWLTCVILATKYHNEASHSLAVWTKWTGLPASELGMQERIVLGLLDYNMHFTSSHLEGIKLQVCTRANASHLKIINMLHQYDRPHPPKMPPIETLHIPTSSSLLTPPTSPSSTPPTSILNHPSGIINSSPPVPTSHHCGYMPQPATLKFEKARLYYASVSGTEVHATTFKD